MRILVEVPISVTVPPRITTKESGIRSREGSTSTCRESPKATGISTITTGVLLRKAEASAAARKNTTSAQRGLRAESRPNSSTSISSAPVRTSAALRTNISPIVAGAGFESAVRTAFCSTSPSASAELAPKKATMSGAKRSLRKARRMPASSANDSQGASAPGSKIMEILPQGVRPRRRNPASGGAQPRSQTAVITAEQSATSANQLRSTVRPEADGTGDGGAWGAVSAGRSGRGAEEAGGGDALPPPVATGAAMAGRCPERRFVCDMRRLR